MTFGDVAIAVVVWPLKLVPTAKITFPQQPVNNDHVENTSRRQVISTFLKSSLSLSLSLVFSNVERNLAKLFLLYRRNAWGKRVKIL